MTVEGPKGRAPHAALSGRANVFGRACGSRRSRGRGGLPRVIERNELEGVTWLHSYVSEDKRRTFCVYDGPSPEAIRKSAADNVRGHHTEGRGL